MNAGRIKAENFITLEDKDYTFFQQGVQVFTEHKTSMLKLFKHGKPTLNTF